MHDDHSTPKRDDATKGADDWEYHEIEKLKVLWECKDEVRVENPPLMKIIHISNSVEKCSRMQGLTPHNAFNWILLKRDTNLTKYHK